MATIREVAKHAGVSIGTVSKVLNGSDERVDPASKERILSTIRALRYKPPPFEKNQKSAIAHNIGMIVPHLTEQPLRRHSYIHLLLDGVLELAAFRGWSVTIFAERMWDDVGNAVRRKYDGRCDGLVVVAPQPDQDIVPSLHDRGAPVVQIGSTAWLEDVSSVDLDNYEVGRMIAKHFMELGHKRLGFVTSVGEQVSSKERYEGFCEAVGKRIPRFLLNRDEAPVKLAQRIAAVGKGRPTALLCWNDGIAIQLHEALRSLGYLIPSDFSIAGVDDSYLEQDRGIRLTTIPNPLHEIGLKSAEMTINRVLDPTLPREIIKFPPSLIVRESTGPVPCSARHPL
jgi:LacI family transcriptional regulator